MGARRPKALPEPEHAQESGDEVKVTEIYFETGDPQAFGDMTIRDESPTTSTPQPRATHTLASDPSPFRHSSDFDDDLRKEIVPRIFQFQVPLVGDSDGANETPPKISQGRNGDGSKASAAAPRSSMSSPSARRPTITQADSSTRNQRRRRLSAQEILDSRIRRPTSVEVVLGRLLAEIGAFSELYMYSHVVIGLG